MNPADDLHVLPRLWKEGSAALDSLLADVAGGSVPSDPQSDLRHVRLNDLQRRITNVWDRLCTHGIVNGPPPRFGLPSGADWYVPPLWVSPWVSSPGSEWTLLRQLLAQGLDGKVLLSRLRERSQTVGAALEKAAATAGGTDPPKGTVLTLLRLFTDGVSDERFHKMAQLVNDDRLTVSEKLTKMDELVPIPPTASAEQLAAMLGVSRQAVMKTGWWVRNRRGEKASEIARRRERHRRRAEGRETEGEE